MRSPILAPRPRLSARTSLAALLVVPLVGGCRELPLALGDDNSIIVTASPELWGEVEAALVGGLERTVFTVRDEKTFTVTWGDYGGEDWVRLRQLRQQLVVGSPEDPWMARALAKADGPVVPPALRQVEDVWARGQVATLMIVEEGRELDGVMELIPSAADLYDEWFRARALSRMFVTRPDSALARSLAGNDGFWVLVPEVYDHRISDSVHMFRNDNPDPSELIRQVAVTWQSPIAPEFGVPELLAWRAEVVDSHYGYPQVVDTTRSLERRVALNGREAHSYQAVWQNPPGEYPAAGPFVTHAVLCPEQDRRYLIDAWLYAPGRDKYEYMIQLEQLVGSFACGDGVRL